MMYNILYTALEKRKLVEHVRLLRGSMTRHAISSRQYFKKLFGFQMYGDVSRLEINPLRKLCIIRADTRWNCTSSIPRNNENVARGVYFMRTSNLYDAYKLHEINEELCCRHYLSFQFSACINLVKNIHETVHMLLIM